MPKKSRKTSSSKKVGDDSHFKRDDQLNEFTNLGGNNEVVGMKVKQCFVIMPFGSNNEYSRGNIESDYVFENIICPALEKFKQISKNDIYTIREVDRNIAGSITKNILMNLANADICIADITGRNPNVFFELGIRYCLREKMTILLKQENTQIPFDIRGYKCITYDCFKPSRAINDIYDFLVTGTNEKASIDSMVFETFPNMHVEIPGIVVSSRGDHSSQILPWDEWWERVKSLASLLKEPFENGRLVPAALCGISNGGLIVADLLGRLVFKQVPILSLWANRWLSDKSDVETSCYFFDNELNKSTVQVLKKMYSRGNSKMTILLTDDLVFTSQTIAQAEYFLRRELKDKVEILFTPLYCRDTDYLQAVEHMLPFNFNGGKMFNMSKQRYFKRVSTYRTRFPYEKDIKG